MALGYNVIRLHMQTENQVDARNQHGGVHLRFPLLLQHNLEELLGLVLAGVGWHQTQLAHHDLEVLEGGDGRFGLVKLAQGLLFNQLHEVTVGCEVTLVKFEVQQP